MLTWHPHLSSFMPASRPSFLLPWKAFLWKMRPGAPDHTPCLLTLSFGTLHRLWLPHLEGLWCPFSNSVYAPGVYVSNTSHVSLTKSVVVICDL